MSATAGRAPDHPRPTKLSKAYEAYADRLSASGIRQAINHIFPDHWSFMLGEIALYAFIFLVLTGVFLALYFVPSDSQIVYHGTYTPLDGRMMSEAYASTLDLSFAVRMGLVMRQAHHWAANIFIGAIFLHMCRVFFTGAFRRPREVNWLIGATMLLLGIFNGFFGYSLPDDLLSGTGVRISASIIQSIPFIGSYLFSFIFGGPYPGHIIDERLYVAHVFIVPALIAALLAVHLTFVWRHEHTQFPEKGLSEGTIRGSPLWPRYAAKSVGLMMVVFAVALALAAFVQINPVWNYGPYQTFVASDAAQPDWYMGWLEGALRLWPRWEIHLPGHMVPSPFFPGVVLPIATWLFIYSWPVLESFFKSDHRIHHLLDSPRDAPVRTAFGVAGITFYFILFVVGGDDVLAGFFGWNLNDMVPALQIALIVLTPLSGIVAWRASKDLQKRSPARARVRYLVATRREDLSFEPARPVPVEQDGTPPIDLDEATELELTVASEPVRRPL